MKPITYHTCLPGCFDDAILLPLDSGAGKGGAAKGSSKERAAESASGGWVGGLWGGMVLAWIRVGGLWVGMKGARRGWCLCG